MVPLSVNALSNAMSESVEHEPNDAEDLRAVVQALG
jgi:hypothetical protein